MRFATYLGIAGALAISFSAMAKNVQPSTDAGQLVAANANLQTNIDAKNAKAGDVVTARLTQSVRIPGGEELHRNTLLIGHIDQVEPAENKGVSTIVLTFDKAQPKNGQPIAIKTTIVGVYPNGTVVLPPDLNPQLQVTQDPSSAHGYTLTSDVRGSNSGVLKADGKNVHLQDGTELEFAVANTAGDSTAGGN
ncbi:MAG TPA: hypothetical protein VGM27_08790 [Acidobacteriaceae bacterium]|jgi:hypothetical protein